MRQLHLAAIIAFLTATSASAQSQGPAPRAIGLPDTLGASPTRSAERAGLRTTTSSLERGVSRSKRGIAMAHSLRRSPGIGFSQRSRRAAKAC